MAFFFNPFCFGFNFVDLFIRHKEFNHLIKEIKFFSLFSDSVEKLFVSFSVFLVDVFQFICSIF